MSVIPQKVNTFLNNKIFVQKEMVICLRSWDRTGCHPRTPRINTLEQVNCIQNSWKLSGGQIFFLNLHTFDWINLCDKHVGNSDNHRKWPFFKKKIFQLRLIVRSPQTPSSRTPRFAKRFTIQYVHTLTLIYWHVYCSGIAKFRTPRASGWKWTAIVKGNFVDVFYKL